MSVLETPRHDCVLVRYGELALKSRRVRARFTAMLRESILDRFEADDLDCFVEDDGGHLYVHSSDLPAAAERLTRVFGVVSVSPASRVEVGGMGDMARLVADYARKVIEPGSSFAVRARRTGHHDFNSMDLARAAGSAIEDAIEGDLSVDLDEPDLEIEVEVRGRLAYIYHQRMRGVGGLPPGSQGRVLCPVREAPDAVASWMLMRRGCGAVVVTPGGVEEAASLAVTLRGWDPALRPRTVPAGEWDWPQWYREMGRSGSRAVVSGARGPDVPVPPPDRDAEPVVFFPLVGLDDDAYSRLERRVLDG